MIGPSFLVILLSLLPQSDPLIPRNTSCSTFLLSGEHSLLVGHNLEGNVFSRLMLYQKGDEHSFIADLMKNYTQFCDTSLGWDDLDAYLDFEEEGLSLTSYIDRATACAMGIRAGS